MESPGFLLDEHITPVIQAQLLAREPNIRISVIGEFGAPSKGTPDPDLLRWIEQANFLLVTANRKSMPVHLRDHLAAGHHVPGILILRRQWNLGRVLDELQLIWAARSPDEFRDQIVYLDVQR